MIQKFSRSIFFLAALFVASLAQAQGGDDWRYITSATIPKGGIEAKMFNNLYTQSDETFRNTFFTSNVSVLYGAFHGFNIGFDSKLRRVNNNLVGDSPFSVFGDISTNGRAGLTGIGPRIRFSPTKKLPKFSVQSTYYFATGENLAGSATEPYIDWNNAVWWTQLFNDFSINDKMAFFLELDFIWEDISSDGGLNRMSTPITAIYSYFPVKNLTVYALAGYSPYFKKEQGYFTQGGLGAKYQLHKNFEIEALYTIFDANTFEEGAKASTFNIGLRYSSF